MYTYCKWYKNYGKYRREAGNRYWLKLCYTALEETANKGLQGTMKTCI